MIVLRALAFLLAFAGAANAATPDGIKVLRDVTYGPAKLQTMDVYLPPQPKAAPVILMVHGGAWRFGDKRHPPVVENKVARWVPKGFIFVSVDYPMVPDSDPAAQADDIARALAAAQAAARGWGGDPELWEAASPIHHLTKASPPWLGVCSINRRASCGANRTYAAKATALGTRAETLGQPLSHGEINSELGKPGAYTDAVEAFMASLDPAVKALLQP